MIYFGLGSLKPNDTSEKRHTMIHPEKEEESRTDKDV